MIKLISIFIINSLIIKFACIYEYQFSVIIAIYNTGRYLKDSIDSILKQSIGFEKIQIILVNDGSIDETEQISLKYKNKYPKNIIYLKNDHKGVSFARNIGLNYAKGKYINFLDADDKWNENAFKYASLILSIYKKIDIVACRMIFFELTESYHPLDYKFYKTRIVNLTEEYNCIQLSTSSSFFRSSSIKNKKFEEGIFVGEDTRFLNTQLLHKPLIGIVKEAIYYYRRRADSSSTIQNKYLNDNFYFSIIKKVDEYLMEYSNKLYKRIMPFIQFYVAYNTLFRIVSPSYKYLTRCNFKKYNKLVENILKKIDDKYILEQKILSLNEKFLALSIKYHRDMKDNIVYINNSFLYYGYLLIDLTKNKSILVWRILEIDNNILHLEGKDNLFLSSDYYFYFIKIGDIIFYPKYYHYSGYDSITMFGNTHKGRNVVFDIPLKKNSSVIIKTYINFKGQISEIITSFGWYAHIPNLENGYYNSGDYILKIFDNRIIIYPYNKSLIKICEINYQKELARIRKSYIIKYRNKYMKYKEENKFKKNEVWIINDKMNHAGDNGEFLFRFLKEKNPKNIDFYFVLKRNCSDFKRLHSLGNLLEYGSEIYLDIFLKSTKIISSIYEPWVDNPFGKDHKYISDLFHFDFIYISNGIIKDDLSK